jgi:hypothetical protein
MALARGAGSTWAGRPPAKLAKLPRTAGDETSGRWFAFLPGVAAGRAVREVSEAHCETGSGVAIRTRELTLAALRSSLVDVAPESIDPQLYPIDD